MVPRTQITSSASSIHDNNPNYRSPDFLTDGVLAAQNRFFFHSDDSDPDPWIQMELTQSWIIARLISWSSEYLCLYLFFVLGLLLFRDWIAVDNVLSTFRSILDFSALKNVRKIVCAQPLRDHPRLEHKMS